MPLTTTIPWFMKYPMDRSLLIKKAKSSYNNQKTRCNNPKDPDYKRYGARGIRVKYSLDAFVEWFVREAPKVDLKDDVYTCGRIDHDGHYEFGNVVVQGRRENTKEVHTRHPNPGIRKQKKVQCIDFNTGKVLHEALGTRAAAKWAGCGQYQVVHCCANETSHTRDWITFKYVGEEPKKKQKIKIAVIDRSNGKIVFEAVNLNHAARFAGTTHKTVSEHARGLVHPNSRLKYTFKFLENKNE